MALIALEGFKPTKPGPYVAVSASDKRDDWPFWYVAQAGGKLNVMSGPEGAVLTFEPIALALADKWNSAEGAA